VAGEDPLAVRNIVLCQFLMGTGLRAFEAAAATWGDLELTSTGDTVLHVHRGKGDKYRQVPPTPRTVEYLARWRQLVVALRGEEPAPADAVFVPATMVCAGLVHVTEPRLVFHWHRHVCTVTVRNIVKEGGTRIGQPRLRPHDLRRTYAGLLEDNEVPIREIQKNLGHSSVATTETYLQDNPSKRAASVRRLTF
jgi:integrase